MAEPKKPPMPKPQPPASHMRDLVTAPGWAHLVQHLLEQVKRYKGMQTQFALPADARAYALGKADAVTEMLEWIYRMADMQQESPFVRHSEALLHLVRLQTGVLEAMEKDTPFPEGHPSGAGPAPRVIPRPRAGWSA